MALPTGLPGRLPQAPANENERILFALVRSMAIRNVSTNDTATDADGTILVDCTTGNRIETLPPAASMQERFLNVKKVDATANTITVTAAAGDLIDGAATAVITAQYTSLQLHSDGAGWWIV